MVSEVKFVGTTGLRVEFFAIVMEAL
jgi:hypothetical protein